ncbi:MAG: DUF1700 domain-containing protein [Alistipes sp.]|nr:DUF1700 domain-containing protein [Alistipes sp.]
MDKREFLKELGKYLEILEEQEQQDILNEYSQHIEMKMKKGMSEKEAIEDFGDPEVLAAEILSAYHVKLQEKTADRRNKIHRIAERSGQWAKSAVTAVKGAGRGLWKGIKWVVKTPVEAFRSLWEKRPRWERKERKQGDNHNMEKYGFMKGIKNFIVRLWNFCVGALFWCARWVFNLILLFFAAIAGVVALICLFGFGVLFVLLIAGYPLIGVTLACFGGLIMSGAFSALLFLYQIKEKRDEERGGGSSCVTD